MRRSLVSKTCTRCGEERPATPEFFHRNKQGRLGFYSICRACITTGTRRRRGTGTDIERRRKRVRENSKRAYWADPERARARVLDWQRRNPDKHAAAESARRARLRGVEVEKIDRFSLYERDGGRCHVCGKIVPRDKLELDHLIPLAKGGPHLATNLRVAHRSCNARRNHGQIPAQLLLIG